MTLSFTSSKGFVLHLLKEMKLPISLSALGMDEQHADIMAQKAFNDPSTNSNPKPLSIESIKEVYLKAVNGDLPK